MASRLPFSPPLVPISQSIPPKGPGVGSLIKYKIDTDLEEFNKNRPGISGAVDIALTKFENSPAIFTTESTEFKDARFYTDYHFLNLANQLKEKTSPTMKPVNVVEPLVAVDSSSFSDNKQNQINASNSESNSLNNDAHSPINSSLWKLQREQYEDRVRYLEEQIKGI